MPNNVCHGGKHASLRTTSTLRGWQKRPSPATGKSCQ